MKTIEELQIENDNLRELNRLWESRFNNMQIWKDSLQNKLDNTVKTIEDIVDLMVES